MPPRSFHAASHAHSAPVIGRAELLAAAHECLAGGGSLLLTGPAGIGKSTVLRALVPELAKEGHTVLRCAPTGSDAQLPFLALIDLFGLVADEVSASLPLSQRTALESALTGRQGSAEQRDGLVLRLALLSLLRALAERTPVLLVVDDLQWVDPASAELLAFAARRVEGLPIRMLAAVRTDEGPAEPTEPGEPSHEPYLRALPAPVQVLPVPPLSYPQLSELVRGSARHSDLPGRTLRDVHRTSSGNPFLALELVRALTERGTPPRPGEPLPVPTSLRPLVLDRLRTLSAEARRTLLVTSAAARPTAALLRDAGRLAAPDELAEAARLGLVEPGQGAGQAGPVRFTHPLISAVLYATAEPRERQAAHAVLAQASADPIERARHLALATPDVDEHVARTLAEAAAVARDRGAPAEAARLGLLSAERTPDTPADTPADPPIDPPTAPDTDDVPDASGGAPAARRVTRRLDAAEDALLAGESALARGTAQEALAEAARPADRVRAWIVVLDSAGQAMADVEDVFPLALADAGDDPKLLAPLRYQLAWRAMLVTGSFPNARTEAARAAVLAAQVGDRRTELLSLTLQAQAERMMGHPDAEHTLARALAEPQPPEVACDHIGPAYIRFRGLLMNDRLEEARTAITELVQVAAQRGAVESQLLFQRGLAETELRVGRCGAALEIAQEILGLMADVGIGTGPVLHTAALAEAAGGSVSRALSLAQDAVHSAERDGDLVYLARNLYALGHARLIAGDIDGAVLALRRVREMERAQGVTDPADGRWQGDLAEALVRAGALGEARELIDDTRTQARRLGRGSVLAVLDRAEGLLAGARGELDSAAGNFRRAKAEPWLELVAAERPAVESAAAPAAAETLRLDGLADAERRVAGLVLEGATNREIAERLCVSVKTVEATLTRIYRKLGIRSRVDIVRLAARGED